MKKIVIACDSFKESMDASTACNAVESGIRRVCDNYEIVKIPLADGGEGTATVLIQALKARTKEVIIKDLMHTKIKATYGYNDCTHTAIIEAASSCGLGLVDKDKRDPTIATSFGLGQMIIDALSIGAKKIIIGLGGTGTNDGGLGMLQALGASVYDQEGKVLPTSVDSLQQVATLDISLVKSNLGDCELFVASDVENPFIGPFGATTVFGKQKGANAKQLEYLEECLTHFNDVVKQQYSMNLSQVNKTGAAGGIGGALYLLGANLVSGIDLVLELTDFENTIKEASYIFSGEGSIDNQTINGKTISGVAKLAKKYTIPLLALAGRVTKDIDELYDIGVTAIFSITNEAKSLDKALIDGEGSMVDTVSNIMRLLER